MTTSNGKYSSSQKALVYTAIGETVLIAGLPVLVIDRITLNGFLIWLLISVVVFGIMYAIEWGKRTIISIEFSGDKIIILKTSTTYQDTLEPKIEIDLNSITKCVKKSKTTWDIEYGENQKLKLNLYAFGSDATDRIISKINVKS
jgi:hypothetical protein